MFDTGPGCGGGDRFRGQPILGRAAKLEQLNRLCGVLGIATGDALAVGDGASPVSRPSANISRLA